MSWLSVWQFSQCYTSTKLDFTVCLVVLTVSHISDVCLLALSRSSKCLKCHTVPSCSFHCLQCHTHSSLESFSLFRLFVLKAHIDEAFLLCRGVHKILGWSGEIANQHRQCQYWYDPTGHSQWSFSLGMLEFYGLKAHPTHFQRPLATFNDRLTSSSRGEA